MASCTTRQASTHRLLGTLQLALPGSLLHATCTSSCQCADAKVACAGCNATGIEASRVAATTPGMRAPSTNCSSVGAGDQALEYWGLHIGPGEIVGILLTFYVVLHALSYLALSQLHKQKR